MTKHKYFNGRKYFLDKTHNRWYSTINSRIQLSHDVWNYYNSEDITIKGDEKAIHHKNGNKSDDRIENLEKMTRGEHMSLHHKGKNNHMFGKSLSGESSPNWKGGVKHKEIYLGRESFGDTYYEIYQQVNSLGEILSSRFKIKEKKINEKGKYNVRKKNL